jgi:hypothetical protein
MLTTALLLYLGSCSPGKTMLIAASLISPNVLTFPHFLAGIFILSTNPSWPVREIFWSIRRSRSSGWPVGIFRNERMIQKIVRISSFTPYAICAAVVLIWHCQVIILLLAETINTGLDFGIIWEPLIINFGVFLLGFFYLMTMRLKSWFRYRSCKPPCTSLWVQNSIYVNYYVTQWPIFFELTRSIGIR